jgi:hypothetical protein
MFNGIYRKAWAAFGTDENMSWKVFHRAISLSLRKLPLLIAVNGIAGRKGIDKKSL